MDWPTRMGVCDESATGAAAASAVSMRTERTGGSSVNGTGRGGAWARGEANLRCDTEAHNFSDSLRQIRDDGHTHRPRLSLIEIALSDRDQNRFATERAGGQHVRQPVAHPPGTRQVDVECCGRVAEQLETGFATLAGTGEPRA